MSKLSAVRTEDQQEDTGRDDLDLLKEIRENHDDAYQADLPNRTAAESDLKMVAGHQWPDDIKAERESEEPPRPCITENRLPQFVRQIVGDMRAQRPAIKVVPDGAGASQEVAEIYTGIIRDVEAKAATKRPYVTAGASAARCGIGHWRVLHDYESDMSFDQCIMLEPIDNPFAVLWDPLATEITRQDASYCFVTDLMSKAAFKAKYPKAQDIDFDSNDSWCSQWLNRSDESIRIAEYWRKRPVFKTLVRLADGSVGFKDKLQPGAPPIVEEREIETFEVECIKTNGFEILEKAQNWPTKHIPIVAVVGEEYAVGEQRVRHSAIRFAKDPQRLYNYWLSTQTEHLALQPKAPFIATGKQIGVYKDMWTEANTKNRPVLLYDADPLAPGAPQRSQPPVGSTAMTDQILRAADAMKATTGIYDAGLGNQSNETSGKAIMARQRESDVGSSEFLDNLAASIAYTGEIIVDLIPHIYDTQRQVRILAEDGSETFEQINERMMTPDGEQLRNALAQGKYAVSVTTGPSYTTKRQEAAESMLAFVQAMPDAAGIVMDLIANNLDWPGAEQFAERFRTMLPPQLQPESDDPEDVQQRQMAQQQAQEAEQVQKQGVMLELDAKAAATEKMRAETQKMLMPEPQKQIDPMDMQRAQAEQALKAGELELQGRELQIKERELALKEQELALKAQELQSQERIELARISDSAQAREQDHAHKMMDMNHQANMAMQANMPREQGEPGEAAEHAQAQQSDRGMEAVGMGLQAIAAVMNRPKEVLRGPNGEVTGIS